MSTKFELTGYGQEKRIVWFSEITHLDVRIADKIEGFDRERYELNINNLGNFTYQYNRDKKEFYIDYEDYDKMDKQHKEHLALVEGKTEADALETLKGKYVSYLKRVPFFLCYGNGKNSVADIVEGLIETAGI